MKELRCLVFTDQEVVRAVLDRRRRVKDTLPVGTVSKVVYHRHEGPEQEGIETRLTITDDNGVVTELGLPETEVTAALVGYCMGRRIPLPVASDKMLHLINGALTLMITMNFNKAPRLVVAGGAEGAGSAAADRLSPKRRVGR
ncbi:hypothetical protein J2848_003781 [Azospirillum lipoferum]|uniref:Uncharacterized protein n=1 Tax=Azospirillum lipoferum TaxID=193 RepID=A0A5A9GE13_AZOLI|nr:MULTISPECIES: hypothetical protein [Azospirillum]KAA0592025.1 hypothetical protein FZ942_29455 [Azospirillum lipoferum]MCP1612101.1 hypothetical protein [Azospirillum lipoferum]MDW5536672.1 hypothetical protein [Azospirillum sp. NL1]